MSNRQTRRAMQGGDIEGADQRLLERQAKALVSAVRKVMRHHPDIPEEHGAKELASILVQCLIEEMSDPTPFIEGAMTQLGWQLAVRSSDHGRNNNARHAIEWFANGYGAGLLEPLAMQSEGSA